MTQTLRRRNCRAAPTTDRTAKRTGAPCSRGGTEAILAVSRGIGIERGLAPRLRLNCLPEIVVIDVLPGS